MKGKKDLSLLCLKLVLLISDLISDCYVAVQYKRAGEEEWFGWTLAFIIIPYYVVTVMAFCQMKMKGRLRERRNISTPVAFILVIFFVFVRLKEEFDQWKRAHLDNRPCEANNEKCNCSQCKKHRETLDEYRKSKYQFAWIGYVEAYMESTPQLWLQVYVMLKKWSFPLYAVLSVTISLISLAWSHTSVENTRRLAKYGHDLSLKASVLHAVLQLPVLTPRLFAIITFTYVYSFFDAFYFLAFSWFLGSIILSCITCCHALSAVCCGDTRCCDPSIKTLCGRLMLSLLLTFYVSETVLESLGFSSIIIKIFFFLEKSAENAWLIYSSIYSNESDLPYPSVYKPFAWSFIGAGFFFGGLSLIIRHIHKRREEFVDNANTTEAQIPESSSKSATNNAFDEV